MKPYKAIFFILMALTGCSSQNPYHSDTPTPTVPRQPEPYSIQGNVDSCVEDQASLREIRCLRKQGEILNTDVDTILSETDRVNKTPFN